MKFRSCDGRRIADNTPGTVILIAPEGNFCYGKMTFGLDRGSDLFEDRVLPVWKTLYVVMPYATEREHGVYSLHTLRIYREGEPVPPAPAWLWDGNLDDPTLTPSIACGHPNGSLWHGHMTDGRLVACE